MADEEKPVEANTGVVVRYVIDSEGFGDIGDAITAFSIVNGLDMIGVWEVQMKKLEGLPDGYPDCNGFEKCLISLKAIAAQNKGFVG